MPDPPGDWKPLLGRKVSIRFVLRGDPEHRFSEAIGVVQGVSALQGHQQIEIRKRNGEVVSVSARDVLAAKMWPSPRP